MRLAGYTKLFEKLDRGTLSGMEIVIETARKTKTKIVVAKGDGIGYISIREATKRLKERRNAQTI